MTPQLLEHVRAEALFVSHLQSSDRLDPESIRREVMVNVRRHGPRGCAELVAQEFGEHPDTAVGRMGWVLDCIHRTYA